MQREKNPSQHTDNEKDEAARQQSSGIAATDVAEALTKSTNPRSYRNAIKRRKSELSAICRQLKSKAKDGKFYDTDVVNAFCGVVSQILCKRNMAVQNRAKYWQAGAASADSALSTK